MQHNFSVRAFKIWLKISFQALIIVNAWGSGGLFGQTMNELCDDRLKAVFGSQGYQIRTKSTRCEGIFESPVKAAGLEIVSLVVGRFHFELEKDKLLHVTVPTANGLVDNVVHVRAPCA